MIDLSRVWPELKAVEKIGEGSFGKVYKCEREEYGIKSVCAVKVISIPQSKAELDSMSFEGVTEEGARSFYSDVVNDFANEIKLMEMLKGAPNIVNVENFKIVERENEIGWDIYIRMEYLQSFVAYSRNKKLSEEDVKRFALDISNALAICSQNGIIHRDIKPDNIFVDKFGSFKLGDFGVARKLEGTMSVMSKKGTYSYMAPEVFRGEKYDSRADIYSLGMIMYKLLNRNRDPFVDLNTPMVGFKERNDAIERRRRGERIPAPVDASPEMAAVILKMVEFNPENRYRNIDDFINVIKSSQPSTAVLGGKAEPVQTVGNEPTVVADDEPTVIGDSLGEEPTVMSDSFGDEPTVMAEKEKKPKKKKIWLIILLVFVGLAFVAGVIIAIVLIADYSARRAYYNSMYNEPVVEDDYYYEESYSDYYYEEETEYVMSEEEILYEEAEKAAMTHTAQGAILFGKLATEYNYYSDSYQRSMELWDYVADRKTIAASYDNYTVGLTDYGTVVATGNNSSGQCDVYEWTDIIAISAYYRHTVGLKSDGTVLAIGNNDYGQCNVYGWDNIVAVSVGSNHTVGLKCDGTVVAVGDNYYGQCDVGGWTDIIAICTGVDYTIGLKLDGTVVATGNNEDGQCNVYGWTDIASIYAGGFSTVGLKRDGSVVVAGDWAEYDFSSWYDLDSITLDYYYIVGVKEDGTTYAYSKENGSMDLSTWQHVEFASVCDTHFVAVGGNGVAVAKGDNEFGECNLDEWTNIKVPY